MAQLGLATQTPVELHVWPARQAKHEVPAEPHALSLGNTHWPFAAQQPAHVSELQPL